MVALPQPAQEVANYKTRLLLEVSCHFGNLQVQYGTISHNLTFTFTEAKRKQRHEKRTKGLKKRIPLTGFTPHIYESVKRTAVRSINYQQATTFYILHISPTTCLMSVPTYRATNGPEGITPCISSCPQCRISKVMCCRYFPCPAGASPPQCRGASGAISNRILPTITHLYGNSHKGGKYRILLKFSAEQLAAIHSSILTDERADSRGHMG